MFVFVICTAEEDAVLIAQLLTACLLLSNIVLTFSLAGNLRPARSSAAFLWL